QIAIANNMSAQTSHVAYAQEIIGAQLVLHPKAELLDAGVLRMVPNDGHAGGRNFPAANVAVSVDIVDRGRRRFGRISEEAGRPFVAIRHIVRYAITPTNSGLPRSRRIERKSYSWSDTATIRDLAASANSSCPARHKAVPS